MTTKKAPYSHDSSKRSGVTARWIAPASTEASAMPPCAQVAWCRRWAGGGCSVDRSVRAVVVMVAQSAGAGRRREGAAYTGSSPPDPPTRNWPIMSWSSWGRLWQWIM